MPSIGHNHLLLRLSSRLPLFPEKPGKPRDFFAMASVAVRGRNGSRHAAAHEGQNQGLIGALTFSVKETAPKQSKEKPEKPGMPTARSQPRLLSLWALKRTPPEASENDCKLQTGLMKHDER